MCVETLNCNTMFDILNKYSNSGSFEFRSIDPLGNVCNAPMNRGGVYIVYATKGNTRRLIYIGCCGLEDKGKIKPRKDGMYGRLVKGNQFEKARKDSWSNKVIEMSLDKLEIEWWDTGEDFPEIVEFCLILEYILINKRLPEWNAKLSLKESLRSQCESFIRDNNIQALMNL